ncbi:MAG: ATP-binding protein, partial [Gammaproteobacteria bacterium]
MTPKQIQRRLIALTTLAVVGASVILGGVMALAYQRMADLGAEQERVVEVQIQRAYLLSEMRDVIRQRAIELRNMLIDPDPFERDAAYLEFLNNGERYMKLRRELSGTELPEDLRQAMEELYSYTAEGSDILVSTAEMAFRGEETEEATQEFLRQGKEIQETVVGRLSQIVSAQAEATRHSFEASRDQQQSTARTVAISGLLGLALVALVTVYVVRQVGVLSRELEDQTVRAQAASRAKSSFLANISHEVRTPVHGVLGMMDLLDGTRLSTDQRDFVATARDSTKALLNILNDVLDFSKAEANKLSLRPEPFDVLETVERVQDMLGGVALGKGLVMFSYVSPDVPQRLVGDAGRVRQILTNLLGNAIKFTPAGEVWVRLAVLRREQGRITLEMAVHDTGVGIAPEDKDRLFQAFSQLKDSGGPNRGGTGLGLAISRKLAQLMEGDIDFQSFPGRGSTFRVRVCLAEEPGHQSSDWPPRMERRRVMLLSRHPHFRAWVGHQLEDWGLDVMPLSTAAEALYRLDGDMREPVSLILMDEDMPGHDVSRFRAELSSRESGVRIPIVAFSSAGAKQSADFTSLRLPLHPRRLRRVMNAVLTGDQFVTMHHDTEPGPRPGAGLQVLSVDDNPINQTVMRLLLERLGCKVHTAEDGEQAVDQFSMRRFDLVLMDAYMPKMDGYEATRFIREIERQRRQEATAIYGISASVLDSDRQRGESAGMTAMLCKPIGSDELGRLLENFKVSGPGPASISLVDLP